MDRLKRAKTPFFFTLPRTRHELETNRFVIIARACYLGTNLRGFSINGAILATIKLGTTKKLGGRLNRKIRVFNASYWDRQVRWRFHIGCSKSQYPGEYENQRGSSDSISLVFFLTFRVYFVLFACFLCLVLCGCMMLCPHPSVSLIHVG